MSDDINKTLLAALKGARDVLDAIPEGIRGNHDTDINRQLRRIDKAIAQAEGTEPEDDGDYYPAGHPDGPCTDPDGHEWPQVEEHERCLCIHCGADGDA